MNTIALKMFFKSITSGVLLVSLCFLQSSNPPPVSPPGQLSKSAPEGLHFFVIGDWGKGDTNQRNVARAMAVDACLHPIDFIISVGDNFYPKGVKSVKDSQWEGSFETIYADTNLKRDWYTAFGNHDYMGWIRPQLNYHKINPLWKTQKRYDSFIKGIPHSTDSVLVVFIDTNPFDGTLKGLRYNGLWRQNKKGQLKWLDRILGESKAKWKIVVGHHPLFTTGYRRDKMLDVREAFLPVFEKHKVDVYFAGHDHDLQHQKPLGYTHYFVSGAGSEFRGVTADPGMTRFAAGDLGFMRIQLTSNSLTVSVINSQNRQLYLVEISK